MTNSSYIVILTGEAEITFNLNTASDYGGAIYSRVDQSVINFNVTNINFYNNHDRTAGRSVFINVPTLQDVIVVVYTIVYWVLMNNMIMS